MKSKYTFLELFFSKYQWVRRRSKSFWVKDERIGLCWVKFSTNELNYYKKILGHDMTFDGYKIEDWRN